MRVSTIEFHNIAFRLNPFKTLSTSNSFDKFQFYGITLFYLHKVVKGNMIEEYDLSLFKKSVKKTNKTVKTWKAGLKYWETKTWYGYRYSCFDKKTIYKLNKWLKE